MTRPPAPIPHALALALCLSAAVVPTACGGDPGEPAPREGPFLYLVLGERAIDASREPGDPEAQFAVLLTLDPDGPPAFRDAIRFAMESPRGQRFGWFPLNREGETVWRAGTDSLFPNWALPDDPWAGLGADDLVPGNSYTLQIDTEGVNIAGTASIPRAISADFAPDSTALAWDAVDGAAGYRVIIDDDTTFTSDVARSLSAADRQGGRILVDALDANAWAYFAQQAPRAGIDRGAGVFGGMTRDTVR